MPKLLWVAAPLLIALAAWAIQTLRGRPPSRHALNVWASVLLLGYVLATAALGIFWVANQQLPVFDWHYLFGYGTLTLIALHLALNFRIVWRYLTRRRIRRERRRRRRARQAPAGGGARSRGGRLALRRRGGVLARDAARASRAGAGDEVAARSRHSGDSGCDARGGRAFPCRLVALAHRAAAARAQRRLGRGSASFKRYPGARRVALPTSAPTAGSASTPRRSAMCSGTRAAPPSGAAGSSCARRRRRARCSRPSSTSSAARSKA